MIEEFIRVKDTGIRVELDNPNDDKGVFLWNADGFIDLELIDNLIETLQDAKLLLSSDNTLNQEKVK